jgi:hypothetical protein
MQVRAFPQIGVIHLGTAQSLRIFFRKQAWHGTHVIKVFLRDVFRSHNRKAVFFAAWTLLSIVAVVIGSAWALVRHGTWWLPATGVVALCVPPTALSLKNVLSSRRYPDFFPLFALYLTYGIARARALLNIRNFV